MVEVQQMQRQLQGEEIGNLGLRGLRLTQRLCYANFAVYLFLYITGMYINIFVTSGINTIGIGDITNIVHMVLSILNFTFTFVVMVVGLLYGMKKVALFSSGAVASIVVATAGGMLFLTTGGSRQSGSLTLIGGWVMSILFMLALFLSYYATLKIVRATRIKEIANI